MKKNCQLHLFLETDLLETLQKEAQENDVSISEMCRQKLRQGSRPKKCEAFLGCSEMRPFLTLKKIEIMLENINCKLGKK